MYKSPTSAERCDGATGSLRKTPSSVVKLAICISLRMYSVSPTSEAQITIRIYGLHTASRDGHKAIVTSSSKGSQYSMNPAINALLTMP